MSVRFRFRNELDYQIIPCDGFHMSVRDIKKAIIKKRKCGKVTDYDLIISNAQTKENYSADDELIKKNTSLIVKRFPLEGKKKKFWEEQEEITVEDSAGLGPIIPSLSTSGVSEEEKLATMMSQSSEMYDKKHWRKHKGRRGLPEGSKPPPYWQCKKCGANHWLKDCPFADTTMTRTTGIPRSFLIPADASVPGAKVTPEGKIVVNEMEKLAYSENKIEKIPWLQDDDKPVAQVKAEVPAELQCAICRDLLSDAVKLPCCAVSACEDCAMTGMIESGRPEPRCPVCGAAAKPEEILSDMMCRQKVRRRFDNHYKY